MLSMHRARQSFMEYFLLQAKALVERRIHHWTHRDVPKFLPPRPPLLLVQEWRGGIIPMSTRLDRAT